MSPFISPLKKFFSSLSWQASDYIIKCDWQSDVESLHLLRNPIDFHFISSQILPFQIQESKVKLVEFSLDIFLLLFCLIILSLCRLKFSVAF